MMEAAGAVQVISESKEAEEDRKVWKVILWGALSIAAGFLFVASFERWLTSFSGPYFWAMVISAVVFWSFATLQVFFIKGAWKLALITLLECALPLGLFWSSVYPAPSYVLLGGAAVTFVLAFAALRRGRSFAQNSVEFRFFDVAKVFLPRFVTAWLIFASVVLYLSYFVWGYFSPNLKTTFLDSTISAAAPILRVWIPGFSLDVSVHAFSQNLALSELQSGQYNPLGVSAKNFTVSFSQLSKQQQTQLLDDATKQVEQAFTARFGAFDPQESMLKFTDGVVSNYFEAFLSRTGWLTPVIVAAAVFFVLKGIVALFYWFIAFIAFVLYKFLIVLGFAYTSIESRSREFVLLS